MSFIYKIFYTFFFLDSFASLRPAIIESPSTNDSSGFHSSASVLLSGLLVLFDTSPSKKNAGILNQYSGGIPPEFYRSISGITVEF